MPVDPFLVHAYWRGVPEEAGETREGSEDAEGSPRAVLRVHDLSAGKDAGALPEGFFDVAIDLASQNWYVHLLKPIRTCLVEIGLVRSDGRFTPLARSNSIDLPAAAPFEETKESRLMVPGDPQVAPPLPEPPRPGPPPPGAPPLRIPEERSWPEKPAWDVPFEGEIPVPAPDRVPGRAGEGAPHRMEWFPETPVPPPLMDPGQMPAVVPDIVTAGPPGTTTLPQGQKTESNRLEAFPSEAVQAPGPSEEPASMTDMTERADALFRSGLPASGHPASGFSGSKPPGTGVR